MCWFLWTSEILTKLGSNEPHLLNSVLWKFVWCRLQQYCAPLVCKSSYLPKFFFTRTNYSAIAFLVNLDIDFGMKYLIGIHCTHCIPKDTTVCMCLQVLWNYQHMLQTNLLFKETIKCCSKMLFQIKHKTKMYWFNWFNKLKLSSSLNYIYIYWLY